jgi:hypothetical protein
MRHETILLGTLLALLGCVGSGIKTSNEERQELYLANSTPVESFRITRLQGRQAKWSPIGDQALLVYDESDQPHLLELTEKCSGLATARSISITNAAGTVTPGSDSVQLMGPTKAGSAYFCRIGTAHRVDMRAVEEAREQMREASPARP